MSRSGGQGSSGSSAARNARDYGAAGDNAANDTARLQALLDAAADTAALLGAATAYVPRGTYVVNAVLVIQSGVTLFLDPTATVKLTAGTGGNMLVNAALANARSVIDAGITSGQATLTSATATFAAGDVGKTVTVVGAGPNGGRLVTTIQSFTNSTTVVLAANATTTVANAWVTIGTRDRDITVRGGAWDRQNNTTLGTGGYTSNTIRLRRVDNVRVEHVRGEGTAGKYFVSLGDVWNFTTDGVFNNGFSDGVHVNGPAQHGKILRTAAGRSGDDVVSLTCSDFTTYPSAASGMADTAGDISDVVIDSIDCEYGSTRAFLLAAGTVGARAMNLSRIKVRNVFGTYGSFGGWIGGDNHDAALLGGNYTDIDIDGVSTNGGGSGTIMLYDGTMDQIRLRSIAPGANDGAAVQIGSNTSAPTIGRVTVDGVAWTNSRTSSGATGAVVIFAGTIEQLTLKKPNVSTPNWSGVNLVYLPTGGLSAPVVQRILIEGAHHAVLTGGSASAPVYQQRADATVTTVSITGYFAKNVTYVLGRYPATTRVKSANVNAVGASSGIRVDATGVVTLEAHNVDTNADGFSIGAGGSLRLLGFGCRGDLATAGIAKNSGDMAFNTNAANGLGATGPAVCNGTNWKHIYAGTTI